MKHELKGTVIGENQGTTPPETNAGAVGIEVVGNGVVRGIQRDGIPLCIHQPRNTGEECVGLAIAAGKVREIQGSATQEAESGVIQAGGSPAAGEIDAQLTIPQHQSRVKHRTIGPDGEGIPGSNAQRITHFERAALQSQRVEIQRESTQVNHYLCPGSNAYTPGCNILPQRDSGIIFKAYVIPCSKGNGFALLIGEHLIFDTGIPCESRAAKNKALRFSCRFSPGSTATQRQDSNCGKAGKN